MFQLMAAGELQEEVKKSRFICRAAPVASAEEAIDFLRQVRDQRATHNCWAFRAGDEARSSDDGEPGGTAGRPILGAIEKMDLDGVVVVVTRFFGGIKLGAGGLVRAYGGIAARCLQSLPRQQRQELRAFRVEVPFALLGRTRSLLERHAAEVLSEDYHHQGAVFEVQIPAEEVEALQQSLADATSGEVRLRAQGPAPPPGS